MAGRANHQDIDGEHTVEVMGMRLEEGFLRRQRTIIMILMKI